MPAADSGPDGGDGGPPARTGAATVDVWTEVTIARPAEVVATFVADPTTAPSWYRNITSVAWTTEPPLQVGSRLAFTARFLGRRIFYTYEVTEFAPAERLTMRTADGPFPMETTYLWEPLHDGSTRMRLRNRGGPGGLARLAAPLLAAAVRRANRGDLERLRAVLEAG